MADAVSVASWITESSQGRAGGAGDAVLSGSLAGSGKEGMLVLKMSGAVKLPLKVVYMGLTGLVRTTADEFMNSC